ncbi:hypothetical protein Mal4_17760 [Maioricimonas rarisocia]|uniref:Uncharacterized protein n=1 Tax=Maioricimonas rarisocia TaxID=2528026 RepID=A0A517Z4P6_9PLAN|nr:hypothetical protein Mal4_17760 [Maioricimonas rarisocia]
MWGSGWFVYRRVQTDSRWAAFEWTERARVLGDEALESTRPESLGIPRGRVNTPIEDRESFRRLNGYRFATQPGGSNNCVREVSPAPQTLWIGIRRMLEFVLARAAFPKAQQQFG